MRGSVETLVSTEAKDFHLSVQSSESLLNWEGQMQFIPSHFPPSHRNDKTQSKHLVCLFKSFPRICLLTHFISRWQYQFKYLGQNWFGYFLSTPQTKGGQLTVVALYVCQEAITVSKFLMFRCTLSKQVDPFQSLY